MYRLRMCHLSDFIARRSKWIEDGHLLSEDAAYVKRITLMRLFPYIYVQMYKVG